MEIAAVAARRPGAADAFARDQSIATVNGSCEELIAGTTLDVIYDPLPPHLHAAFSIKALEAGNYVQVNTPGPARVSSAPRESLVAPAQANW